MNSELAKDIEIVSKENIYFGHRSVGENIISGIKEIVFKNEPGKLLIHKIDSAADFSNYYFLDSNIGKNGNPESKIEEFKAVINKLADKNLNIAMMKFCYVDITASTDVNKIFNDYVKTVDSIQNKYSNLMIIHFTVPLTSEESLYRKVLNVLKGTSEDNVRNNMARNKFNELLLSKYSPDTIFDLAKIESTFLDGRRAQVAYKGNPCYFLVKDYTDDGGHLNEQGRQIAASKLLTFLAERIAANYSKTIQLM